MRRNETGSDSQSTNPADAINNASIFFFFCSQTDKLGIIFTMYVILDKLIKSFELMDLF